MERKFRVLITTKLFGVVSDEPVRMLEQAGCEVIKSTLRHPIGPGGFAEIIGGFDAAIIGSDIVDKEAIDAADRLKVICMHGAGLDSIDVEYASLKGVVVKNLPGENAEGVAELCVGLLFNLARRISLSDRMLREGHWRRQIGDQVSGKRLGIVGLGAVGKVFAIKARALGLEVVACNRSKDEDFAGRNHITYLALDELLSTSDYVSLHVPLTEETANLMDDYAFAKMKEGSFLINTGRGGLVDENALYEALKSGHLAGAALDVFRQEPLAKDSPLLALENCILTPHIGAQSKESLMRTNKAAVRAVLEVLLQENGEEY